MKIIKKDKIERILGIYTKFMNETFVNKVEEAQKYQVNKRTIQRDIDDIKNFLKLDTEAIGYLNSIIYDRIKKAYRMEQTYTLKLKNSEVFALCKILLDSRAFPKEEMLAILDKFISCCVPQKNRKLITKLISNETFHYMELKHKVNFIDFMWEIGQAIESHHYIEIEYIRTKDKDKTIVTRKVEPVAIVFSEYYFYLTAFIDDEIVRENFDILNDSFPTIYRIDRIKKVTVLEKQFSIPYSNRFEEGEFRKRIQFMYGGKLQRVQFIYQGNSVEAILDRLPTATIQKEKNGKYFIEAEVFGKGIEMWIKSQGDAIEVIKPKELRETIKNDLKKALQNYE